MNAITPVLSKLEKLIPLLGTDRDGECLATVRAIGRTLGSAGLDWHALATALADCVGAQAELDTWHALARWCLAHDNGRLSPKAREFVRDMSHRLVCGGTPTEKQAAWLRAIYAKLRSTAR